MTKKDTASEVERLVHIVEEVDFLGRALAGVSEAALDSNEEKLRAVKYSLAVIGESSGRLLTRHEGFPEAHPEMAQDMADARETRHGLVHDYFMEVPSVWATAVYEVPELREQALDVLRELAPDVAERLAPTT